MGGMSTRNEIKARLGVVTEPKATFARPGRKVRAGILDRIGAAASALTASPADPTSPQYKSQLAAARKEAQSAVANYKFMRDKAKARQDAMDKYVMSAIKVINASTNVQDVAHFTEQVQVAVRALSTMMSSVKTPFARKENKMDVLYGEYAKLQDYVSSAWNWANNYVYDMKSMLDLRKSAKGSAMFEEMKKLAGQLAMMERQLNQVDAYSAAGLKKGIELGKKLVNQASPLLRRAKELYQQFRSVVKASRPGAKAKFAAHPENVAWMRALPASVVSQVRSILQKPHSSARAKQLRDVLKAGGVAFNQWVPDASAGAEVLGHQFRDAFAKTTHAAPAQKPGRKVMSESDPAVSAKIRKLMAEGKPQKQAVAIALDMKRRGEI